jgi:putative two-component system response regulator
MRILAVDDNPTNLYLLETLLKAHGDEVISVSTGADALLRLAAGPFDLVISDILMPGMDGFKFCREVKMNPKTKDIPFVFYTATYTEDKDRELALKLGASRFVLKPEAPEKFLAIIDEVVRERETGRMRSMEMSLSDDDA